MEDWKLFCAFDSILEMRVCLHCRAVMSCNCIKCCEVKSRRMRKPLSAVAFLTEGCWVVERCVLKICDHGASLASASHDRRSNGNTGNPNVSGPQIANNPQPAFKKSAQGYQVVSSFLKALKPSENTRGLKKEG